MSNVSVVQTRIVQQVKTVLMVLVVGGVIMMRNVNKVKSVKKGHAGNVNPMKIAQAAKNAKMENVFVMQIWIVLEVKSVEMSNVSVVQMRIVQLVKTALMVLVVVGVNMMRNVKKVKSVKKGPAGDVNPTKIVQTV
jgi:hypothetical protein